MLESVGRLKFGALVNVKNGYARNYLIPMNKAVSATKDNLALFESQKDKITNTNNIKKEKANILKDIINDKNFIFVYQASSEGKLYGSLRAKDVINEIQKMSNAVELDGSCIQTHTIKTIGKFRTKVSIFGDVEAWINIVIGRSHGEAEALLNGTSQQKEENKDQEEALA